MSERCTKCIHIARDEEEKLISPGRLLWSSYPARIFLCTKWNGFITEEQSAEQCKDYIKYWKKK